MSNRCNWIATRGANKGLACGKAAIAAGLCSRHINCKVIEVAPVVEAKPIPAPKPRPIVNTNRCEWVRSRGATKGTVCGDAALHTDNQNRKLCYSHYACVSRSNPDQNAKPVNKTVQRIVELERQLKTLAEEKVTKTAPIDIVQPADVPVKVAAKPVKVIKRVKLPPIVEETASSSSYDDMDFEAAMTERDIFDFE